MGLKAVLGRLLNAQDDGPKAAGAVVLTHRFWTTSLKSELTVLGKTIRLGARSAVIVGVLEPAVPYPAETELIVADVDDENITPVPSMLVYHPFEQRTSGCRERCPQSARHSCGWPRL